jgi:hypothetical protein
MGLHAFLSLFLSPDLAQNTRKGGGRMHRGSARGRLNTGVRGGAEHGRENAPESDIVVVVPTYESQIISRIARESLPCFHNGSATPRETRMNTKHSCNTTRAVRDRSRRRDHKQKKKKGEKERGKA